ncbi:MAG TPA: vWA domain-containing protein [Hyphomicrobiaceae bacterium]|nr:vWA domain-containing protein [Hyphomicrobiaceae bacterium]
MTKTFARARLALAGIAAVALLGSFGRDTVRAQQPDVECKEICRVTKTGLALKVLPRVNVNIYKAKDIQSPTIQSNVDAFVPLLVFERDGIDHSNPTEAKGWYKVGHQVGQPLGFMRATDVLEWRNAVVVSYSHRGTGDSERKPVIMFQKREQLLKVMESHNPLATAANYYKRLDAKDVPEDVITREPDTFVDIKKKFYLLPVLQWLDLTDQGFDDTRILQIAAAVPGRAAVDPKAACTTQRKDFNDCIQSMGTVGDDQLTIDVVYVIDFSGSMQSYINAVNEATRNSAKVFAAEASAEERIKFGLVSYTDTPASRGDSSGAPVAVNHTAELVTRAALADIIARDGKVIPAGGDIQEETFAGVLEGINARWRSNSVRLIILIGDASGHETSHPQNTTGKDARALRLLATEQNIYIATLYIKNPQQATDWALGQDQFRVLAENPGTTPNFKAVDADPREIENALSEVTAEMVQRIRKLKADRKPAPGASGAPVADAKGSAAGPVGAFRAALVEYIGRATEPPPDITAWVLDKDMTNHNKRAFDVHVLATRADLDQLTKGVQNLIEAYELNKTTNEGFFNTLRSMSATLSVDFDVSKSDTLSKSPLIPRWIESLPYKSEIMTMRFQEFEDMNADKRQSQLNRLKSLVQLYRSILERQEAWVKLNETMPHDQHVYPLPLDNLP